MVARSKKNPDGSITTGFIPRRWYADKMPGELLDGEITVYPGDPLYPEVEKFLRETTHPFKSVPSE